MNLKISFDNNLKDFSKLKYIIVGDNPGNDEYKEGKYFIGSSGTTLRKHFLENDLVSNFDEECIIFNKTFLSTKGTDGLIQVKKDIGEKNFNNILIHTAHEIANFSNNLEIPIFILGKSKLDKGKIFHPFWLSIINLCRKNENIFVLYHTSYGNFKSQWNEYEIDSKLNSKELLKLIGRKNYNSIKV